MAKYLKPYCEKGFVEDSAEIEYLKFNNMRHAVLGCMLGDFNEQGIYTISPDIVSELILMRKYIVDSMDNIEICLSELKLDKQLTFMVTFEANRATLSLVEKINMEGNYKLNSGSYSNINEYILDEVETAGEINRNIIYKKWNISEFGGKVLDISSMDEQTLAKLFGIVNRYKYLLLANAKLLESEPQIEEVEAEYTLSVLEATKAYPKLHKAVLENIKSALTNKKGTIRLDKPNFAKTLNEVLDDALDEHLSLLTEEERKNFEIDKHNAELKRNQSISQVVDIKKEEVKGKLPQSEYIDLADKTKSVFDVGNTELITLDAALGKFNTARKESDNRLKNSAMSTLQGAIATSLVATSIVAALVGELVAAGVDLSENVGKDVQAELKKSKKETKQDVAAPSTTQSQQTPAPKVQKPMSAGASKPSKPQASKKPSAKKNSASAKPKNEVKKNKQQTTSASSNSSRNNYTTYPRRERQTDTRVNEQTNAQTGGQAQGGKTTGRRGLIGNMTQAQQTQQNADDVDDIVDYNNLGVRENTVERINNNLLNENTPNSSVAIPTDESQTDLNTVDQESGI